MQVPGTPYGLFGVFATSAQNAWAVGIGGSGQGVILRWNGQAWRQYQSGNVTRELSPHWRFRAMFTSAHIRPGLTGSLSGRHLRHRVAAIVGDPETGIVHRERIGVIEAVTGGQGPH
jgi:hypothetical protein